MKGPVVFVSYTSRDELSRELSRELFERLRAEGFLPWRDEERLRAGERWHEELTRNLMGSHAAVALLTPEALRSEWVLKEVTYLAVRADGAPRAKLVCFLLDGVTPADLADGRFAALQLTEHQLVTCPPGEVAEHAVAALAEIEEGWSSRLPTLLDDARLLLEASRVGVLLRMAASLRIELDDWFPDRRLSATLALALAERMSVSRLEEVARCLAGVHRLVDEECARHLLEALWPFRVDESAARRLADLVERRRGGNGAATAVGIDAKDPRIGRLYLLRTLGSVAKGFMIEIEHADGEMVEESLPARVRDALMEDRGLEPDEAEYLVEELAELEDPRFVFLPPYVKDEDEIVRRLKEDFAPVCFLILSWDLPKSHLWRSRIVELLKPLFGMRRERRILREYRRAKQIVDRSYKTD